MVRHYVAWSFKDELSVEERKTAAEKIKKELEALVGVVPGLIQLEVYTNALASAESDLMLESTLEDEEALEVYRVHDAHVKVAQYVRSVVKDRKCLDFEV